MSRTVPLTQSASVKLDGSGNGSVQLGPALPGVSWSPASVAVIVQPASTTVVSQFRLYLGPAQPGNFQGGTYTGDVNSTDITVPAMYAGQVLTGVWSGGNPAATATMTLTGTQQIPG
jgi:hypothetical protein